MKKSFLQPNWVSSTKLTRFKQLKPYFENQDVLDIGCAVGYKKSDWMHKNIKSVACTVCGIDIDSKSLEEIRKDGYDVQFGDALKFDLGKKFSLIHAGELIEHIENPGSFLESVREHLKEGGQLLLTTPNGLRISNFIYASLGGLAVNKEHVCWYCEYTLSTLLERKGFEVVSIGYLKHETFNWYRKLFLNIRAMVLPQRVAWNTLYVLAKVRGI